MEYRNFVKENINKMPQKSPQKRMKAVAKLWKSKSQTLYDVLVNYMDEVYAQPISNATTRNIRFSDNQGRKIYLQVKWNRGHARINGELIIKEISIEPRGGDVLSQSVSRVVTHPNVNIWGLNKVVLESVLDRGLFEKLQLRGWTVRLGFYSNLYWYVPNYTEPTLMEMMGLM